MLARAEHFSVDGTLAGVGVGNPLQKTISKAIKQKVAQALVKIVCRAAEAVGVREDVLSEATTTR